MPWLTDMLNHDCALKGSIGSRWNRGRIGGGIRRSTKTPNPIPGLRDDLLQAVDRFPRNHRYAVDDRHY